ncbi:preprotein translocase subunit YajC [Flexivirga aerilata]|uniref:preprotein translocase subunit YajC n=1 Tax=Flexivirga aerilata TaxID=1656889 RepID=UPI001BB263FF|nr:preprotein translocase subunit YajC [Flexivirga aerilata]
MGTLLFLIPLVLLAWLFWQQRRRQQQMAKAQSEITIGSEVSTTSGLLGTLVAMDDEIGTIEVSPGVQLRFDRRAIVPRTQLRPGATGAAVTTEPVEDQPAAGQGTTDLSKTNPSKPDPSKPDLSKPEASPSEPDRRDDNPETKA